MQTKNVTESKNIFSIVDIDKRSTTISVDNSHLSVSKVMQPMVMINIFADWSPPSCGMIPYLDSLQKKYPKDLFVIGVVVNSDLNDSDLRAFMKKHHASYFISNSRENDKLAKKLTTFLDLDANYPIPLTILFNNGEYNRHYIGATPVEMIEADIEQLRRYR